MRTRLSSALLLSIFIAGLGYRRRFLSPSGVAAALLVGTLTLGLGGWLWAALLGLFFLSSSLLSHFREGEKRAVAEKFDKGHYRDFGQVLANGGLGALVALFNTLYPSPLWFLFFLGVMATVNADTWATEVGTLSKRPPRLITTGRPVATGTSGAVSRLGLAVSFLGGMTIGLGAGLLQRRPRTWSLVLIGGLSGLAGSLFDSLLGATVQRIYYCNYCKKDTERTIHSCGNETHPLRGWSWLNNDLVNLLASLVGGLTALALWLLLGQRKGILGDS